MAWDKTLPNNSTKMRVYPQVLTDNFKAIEEGDSTLQQWSLNLVRRQSVAGPIANDPTREDNLGWLYTKGGGTEETELYYQDSADPANVIQLTSEGKMGSSNTEAIFSNITVGTTPIEISTNLYIVAQGSFDASGNLLTGVNMSTHPTNPRPSTGVYNVNVDADILLNSNYRVLATVVDNSSSQRNIQTRTKAAPVGGVATTIQLTVRGASSAHNEGFDIIVVGGR